MTNNFTHRILQAEITPPDIIWNKIADELDHMQEKSFVQKLAQAELDPPAQVWDNIESSLAEHKPDSVILIRKKPIKWAIAAAIAGGLIVSIAWFLNSAKQPDTITKVEKQETKNGVEQPPATPDTNTSTQPVITGIAKNDALPKKSRTVHYSAGSGQDKIRHAAVGPAEQSLQTGNTSEPGTLVNYAPSSANTYIPAPDYYTVSAPNGQLVRISSKFSDAANYFFNASDDNTDNSWKRRFDTWKNKLMSNPSFIPTGGNFLDIIELKELLKDQ